VQWEQCSPPTLPAACKQPVLYPCVRSNNHRCLLRSLRTRPIRLMLMTPSA
jgi:hypothetical protein